MVKSKEEVIAQFNEEVNMTADELEAWLEDPKSSKAGTGVGVESGHKIVEILRKNPTRDPEKYDEEDLEHMRKVVGYANRHLAQEDHLKETKTREELEDAKSTISLKNWGHDPVKAIDEQSEEADVTSEVAQINGHAAEESTEAGDGEPTANGDEGPNADGDGEPTTDGDGEAVGNAERAVDDGKVVEPAKEKEDEEMGEEDIGEKTPSKKRKLDEDEPSQVEGTVKDGSKTNGHVQVEESQADSGDEKAAESQVPDSDDPPSKKSKVDESS